MYTGIACYIRKIIAAILIYFELLSRLALVSGLKWVDQVIADAPYEITEEFMDRLFKEHKIDYIIHGDDPCLLPDGTDAYALAKIAGRYKQIKRTEGVSSTDIVGTIILLFLLINLFFPVCVSVVWQVHLSLFTKFFVYNKV